MKIVVIVLLALVLAFFAYNSFQGGNSLKSDESMKVWIDMCESNNKCKEDVKEHYAYCADSSSFEMPNMEVSTKAGKEKMQRNMAEYYTLVTAEIGDCLSDKTGLDFPAN